VQGRFEQPCDELSGNDGSDGCREASGAAAAPTLRRSTGCYRRDEALEDSDADDGRACERGRLRSLVMIPDRAAVRRSHSPDDVYGGCKEPRRSAGRSQRSSTHRRRSGSRRSRRQRRGSRGGGHGSSSADDSDGGAVVHSSRRHRIKPRTFDGSGSFETFWAHFKNCATYNRWGEADKLAHLKASLVGDAGQVLRDSEAAATDTLEKLTTLLRSRYSSRRLPAVCWRCGEPGHMQRNCGLTAQASEKVKKLPSAVNRGSRGLDRANVYLRMQLGDRSLPCILILAVK